MNNADGVRLLFASRPASCLQAFASATKTAPPSARKRSSSVASAKSGNAFAAKTAALVAAAAAEEEEEAIQVARPTKAPLVAVATKARRREDLPQPRRRLLLTGSLWSSPD
ncbi:UNVERIFIED_CONTAM: hypothetical protein Sradi_6371200 [Sesamum radiatum]|uniref:Uncharacterized protein n=1 Tax=Sesamum radiatum TaxID=300843 RepID=A0AAW2K276_SESRA